MIIFKPYFMMKKGYYVVYVQPQFDEITSRALVNTTDIHQPTFQHRYYRINNFFIDNKTAQEILINCTKTIMYNLRTLC